MKKLLLLLLVLNLVPVAEARTKKVRCAVTVGGVREACPVVLRDVPAWVRSVEVRRMDGEELPVQLDRLLDEAAFVADIAGRAVFEVRYSSRPPRRSYSPRVHAQMWWKNPDGTLRAADTLASRKDDMYRKLHHHGPAFESERAAYRIYFDKKQTIDTYGKKLPRLELAETLWYPSDEQLAAGYGHDNLRVFGTVGVGALKGWDAAKGRMVHIVDMERREARILARGPVRTVVEMRVEGWACGGDRIAMTSRYILYAGHSDVRVENTLEGDLDGHLFTTGVMKMRGSRALRGERAVAAVGCDYPENDTLRWERETVALALALDDNACVASRIDDEGSYLFQLVPDARGRIDYHFDMWWRKSGWLGDRSDDELLGGALEAVRRAAEPIRVELQP